MILEIRAVLEYELLIIKSLHDRPHRREGRLSFTCFSSAHLELAWLSIDGTAAVVVINADLRALHLGNLVHQKSRQRLNPEPELSPSRVESHQAI
jgi:hypothetical protein